MPKTTTPTEPTPIVQFPTPQAMPKRVVTVPMPREYGEAGQEITFWVNPPREWASAIETQADMWAFLERVTIAHNGWKDYDGAELPPVSDPAFWARIPGELIDVLPDAFAAARQILPNSTSARKGS